MAAYISSIYDGAHMFADTAIEQEKPTHSALLGPDGRPLAYKQQPIGFDLRPSRSPAKDHSE